MSAERGHSIRSAVGRVCHGPNDLIRCNVWACASTHVRVIPPLGAPEVEVLRKGAWWPGFLEHWRKDGHRWSGNVRYSVGVGQTYIGWVDQDRIESTKFQLAAGPVLAEEADFCHGARSSATPTIGLLLQKKRPRSPTGGASTSAGRCMGGTAPVEWRLASGGRHLDRVSCSVLSLRHHCAKPHQTGLPLVATAQLCKTRSAHSK